MSEKSEQNAPERCSCCTCGYTWVKGQHGGHSCAQVMEVTIADLRARLAKYEDAEGRTVAGHLAVINKAYMALTGYLPGHRNTITDEAIEACRSALKSFPVSAGDNTQPSNSQLMELARECAAMPGGSGMLYANYGREVLRRWGSKSFINCGLDERAAFEAFAKSTPYGSQLHYVRDALPADDPRYGEYVSEALRLSWEGWQARAALSAPSHGEQVRDGSLSRESLTLAYRLITKELETLANGSAIDRFKSAQDEFRSAIAAAPSPASQEQG